MKNNEKQTGKVNYFMTLAGGYLVYLAYKLLRSTFSGKADYPLVYVGAAVLFIVVGGWLLYREWKAYKYGQEHIDDPESWSDDPEDCEEDASGELDADVDSKLLEETAGEDEETT